MDSGPRAGRASLHVEPTDLIGTARHYIRDLVYGANDGVITTFAVVAGVTGGTLEPVAVLVVGAANLLADGLSMGVGNYHGIRSEERVREAQSLPELEAHPVKHGVATFILSSLLSLLVLFAVGAARVSVATGRWWASGLEMLGLGAVVGFVAYGAGAGVARLVEWMR
jgi:VIT1/CCC1 family predicted Fe2+/Mn2+ transporter